MPVMRVHALALIVALACAALAACGGGGGGGNTGGGGGATPQSQVPPSLSFSMVEGPTTNMKTASTTFQFYAPTDDQPTNLQLIGNDAIPFTFLLSAGDANTSGYRTMTVRVQTSTVFNYEDPRDVNRDNIYTFVFSLVYRGQTLTTTINVAITDVADNLELEGVTLEGEAVNQLFGLDITPIPDITGDGKPELGASILSGLGPASAYVMSSEFYTSIPKGTLNVANLGNGGTRFSQTPPATPYVPNRANIKPNLLTALPRPSGPGVDILLSDAARNKAYLFQISQPSDYNALRGTIDPSTISNAVVYTLASGGLPREARLLGDVNGDGLNDIFVQEFRAPFLGVVKLGIIFGRPVTSPADRNRTDTFDIEFTADRFGEDQPLLITRLIPDITGDGFDELVISAPSFPAAFYPSQVNDDRLFLIKSPILRGPTPKSVTLQFATTDPVKAFRQISALAFFQINDLDNDGIRSLFITTTSGGRVIDGNDFSDAAGSNTLSLDPPTLNVQGGGGRLVESSDLDNDNIRDLIGTGGKGGGVVRGARLNQGLGPVPGPDPAIPGSLFIDMSRAIVYQITESRAPVWLGPGGAAAFGFASLDGPLQNATSVAATSGKIVLVRESDIKLGISSAGSTQLEVY